LAARVKFHRLLSPLCVALALVLGGCDKPKNEPLQATLDFFKNIAAGKYHEAYDATAFAFQAQQSEKAFVQTLKELGLHEAAKADIETPVIKGREAQLDVQVHTLKETTLKFKVTLLLESRQWRIFSLRSPTDASGRRTENRFTLMGKSAAAAEALNQPMPDEKELKRMTDEALMMFNAAVKQKSFEEFYEWTSLAWQDQLTLGKLQRAFQPFIDKEIDLSGVQKEQPIFDVPPAITTEGLLAVEGHYPTKPNEIGFSLRFIYESPKWRLFGMSVNLRK
jgi:hypothetical protein